MRKRWLVLTGAVAVIALCGLAAAAMMQLMGKSEPEWTTRSKAALGKFEQGLEDMTRSYYGDARQRLERAVELDPEFVAAKLHLGWIQWHSSGESEQLNELREADLEPLNPRERFLLRYCLAYIDGERDEAKAVLSDFLAEYPTDQFGLQEECDRLWGEQDLPGAEACYQKLIELHPNWVLAYDRLGFVAMAQGRFTEAEEHFQTYRYIAPDQALPHTSLAELLILLGRYEEAEEKLQEALAVKDDFCQARYQLVRVYYLSDRMDDSIAAIDRVAEVPNCAFLVEKGALCRARGVVAFLSGDLEESWAHYSNDCLERGEKFDLVAHDVAVATGRLIEAEELEERLHLMFEKIKERGRPAEVDWYEAARAHLEGIQLLAAGDHAGSNERLAEADKRIKYWSRGMGSFKLLNRMFLARSLERSGKASQARAVLKKVEAVNPRFAEHFSAVRLFPDEP